MVNVYGINVIKNDDGTYQTISDEEKLYRYHMLQAKFFRKFYSKETDMKKYSVATITNRTTMEKLRPQECDRHPDGVYRIYNLFADNLDYETAKQVLIELMKVNKHESNRWLAIVESHGSFWYDRDYQPENGKVQRNNCLSEANHEDIENSIQHQLDVIDGKLSKKEISQLEYDDLHNNIAGKD